MCERTSLACRRFGHALAGALKRLFCLDPTRDFAAVSNLVTTPNIVALHPSVKADTVGEFVALLKEKPNAITYASAGDGSPGHLSAERFQMATRIITRSDFREKLLTNGAYPAPGAPAEFAATIAADLPRYGELIKRVKIEAK